MAINRFKRKNNYFSTMTKPRAEDIDSQYNNIVNYINNNIIPFINNLISEQFIGSDNPALRNSFLMNVGDSSIKWSFITNDNFSYNGLSLTKIEQAIDNSILVSNSRGEYEYVAPDEKDQILQSQLNSSPIFAKIIGACFYDRSVMGKHIALHSVGIDNLSEETYNLSDNSIVTMKFTDNCITTDVLEDGGENTGLTTDKLTVNVAAAFSTMITSNMLYNGYLLDYFDTIFNIGNSYSPLSINEYKRITNFDTAVYPGNKLNDYDSSNVKNYNLNNLALNSIIGDRLHYFNSTTSNWFPVDNDLIEDGAIYPEHLTPELRTLLDL